MVLKRRETSRSETACVAHGRMDLCVDGVGKSGLGNWQRARVSGLAALPRNSHSAPSWRHHFRVGPSLTRGERGGFDSFNGFFCVSFIEARARAATFATRNRHSPRNSNFTGRNDSDARSLGDGQYDPLAHGFGCFRRSDLDCRLRFGFFSPTHARSSTAPRTGDRNFDSIFARGLVATHPLWPRLSQLPTLP